MPSPDWAMFLDVDGSLLEIQPRPDAVHVSPALCAMLAALHAALGGAVALISGRPLDDVDRLFAPLKLPAAGQHGLERRAGNGRRVRPPLLPDGFNEVEAQLAAFAARHPGLLLERKTHGLALHYRNAPACAGAVSRLTRRLAAHTRPPLVLVEGKMVAELRAPGGDKGAAIGAFMTEVPFRGRTPVFVGDDVTDEDGFSAVNALGGHSILVGERASAARWRIASVGALGEWLAAIPARLRKATQ